jgi:hypothetical protein
MFFCPNCNNAFNITKNPPVNKQVLKSESSSSSEMIENKEESRDEIKLDHTAIISKIINQEDLSEEDMQNLYNLTKSPAYKKLKQKQKDLVNQKLDELAINEDGEVSAYFICEHCFYYEPIKDGTEIINRNETIQVFDSDDKLKVNLHSKIMQYTRKYICPNKECVSHKDHKKREAIFFRTRGYNIKYICTACQTVF